MHDANDSYIPPVLDPSAIRNYHFGIEVDPPRSLTPRGFPTVPAPRGDEGAAAFERLIREEGEFIAVARHARELIVASEQKFQATLAAMRCECGGNRECPACLGERP